MCLGGGGCRLLATGRGIDLKGGPSSSMAQGGCLDGRGRIIRGGVLEKGARNIILAIGGNRRTFYKRSSALRGRGQPDKKISPTGKGQAS